MNMHPVTVERRIRASPETIFSFFTDRDRWLSWQGIDGTLNPEPGGSYRIVIGDVAAAGRFLEIDPPRRIVFTWGFEDNPQLPLGSSRVEIELVPEGDDTLVRVTHYDLPADTQEQHRFGWTYYLERLETRSHGGDPGADLLMRGSS